MSRNTGTFNFAANFEGLLKAPIDGRQLVGTYADLTLSATWNASGSVWLYNGAIVVVGSDPTPSNNGVYWLCDATNYTMTCSWVQVGTGSGTLTGATNGLSISGRNVVLGGALTGDTAFSGGVLKYSTPQAFTNDSQIVDKGYVDSVALGLDPKLAVDVATTSGITLSGLTTVDGILLADGDRVLVKNQGIGNTGHTDNGIYIASANTWTRATDFDTSGNTVQGSLIPVISGFTQGNTLWVLITPDPVNPGATPMEFTLFSTVTMTAGNSIIITGSTINVDISTGTLSTALNNLQTTKLDVTVFDAYTGMTQSVLNLALTGATNGLTPTSDRRVALGGALTGNTSIDTSFGTLSIGSPNNSVVIDIAGAVLIGDETLGSNYIRTSSSATDVIASLGNLNLCGNNVTMGTVNLNYAVHPTIWTNDTQLVDKKYVDDFVSGGTTYNCASPATVTVGGVTAGTVLTGKTTNEILKEILVPYLLPTFSAFGSTVIPSSVEVGCVLSGSKAFCWTFTNASNVAASTMCIRDVYTGSTLATNISTTSPQSATVTTRTFVSCGQSQIWCGSAKNSCGTQFGSSTYTTTAYLPYYYGKCTCPGPSGANRPTGTSAMVVGGTKVLAAAAGDITIAYNSTANDYLWFAIPSSVLNKNCWCCNPSINGTIGGAVSPGGNLFPAPDYENISVSTACWTANYDVYISNKQSIAGTLKMGNV